MGGAVFNMQGNLTIRDSTIANNDAFGGADSVPNHAQGIGGAVFDLNGSFIATGSTFAKNSASAYASQIYNLEYDGAQARTAQTTLRDTIVFGGTGGGFDLASDKNTFGITPPVGSSADANVSQFDLVGTTFAQDHGTITGSPLTSNPLLGPLQDNGGPTDTMALNPASPAIDAGGSFGLSTDQRGDPRRVDFSGVPNASGGNGADIGALEVQKKCATQTSPAQACHSLTVRVTGSGTGRVTGPGISCPGKCSASYAASTTVALTAAAQTGSVFTGWSGGCSGTGTCTVKMTQDRAVTATFKPIPPPNTTITGASVSSSKRRATFSFKGTGGVGALRFKCKLDNSTFALCSSPKTYSQLKRGSHTFEVKSIDARSKADPTPATRSFRI
jgi:hypothetical protein